MTSILTSKPVGMPTPLMSDDALYEVVNGQRVELPPMSIYAVWIGYRLQARLAPFAEAKKLGTVVTEALFILDAQQTIYAGARMWRSCLPSVGPLTEPLAAGLETARCRPVSTAERQRTSRVEIAHG